MARTLWVPTSIASAWSAALQRASDGLGKGTVPGPLAVALGELLSLEEIEATRARVAELLDAGRFPGPNPDWPAIPWPPY